MNIFQRREVEAVFRAAIAHYNEHNDDYRANIVEQYLRDFDTLPGDGKVGFFDIEHILRVVK